MNRNANTHRGAPIACNLPSEDFRRRSEEVAQLFENFRDTKELEDGISFEFAGDDDSAERLLEFVKAERGCCPFLTFELAFEPNQGPIWLRLRGSREVKAFVETAFLEKGGRR